MLTGASAALANVIASQAVWDNQQAALTLAVAKTIAAGVRVSVSFVLENPTARRPEVEQRLQATVGTASSGTAIAPAPFPSSVFAGGVAAMSLWALASIGESSASPGAANTITVTLRPEMPVVEGQVLTIHGLARTQTATNPALRLDEAGAVLFGRKGDWETVGGTLKLTVASGQKLSPLEAAVFTFQVTNPRLGVTQKHVIKVEPGPHAAAVSFADRVLDGQVLTTVDGSGTGRPAGPGGAGGDDGGGGTDAGSMLVVILVLAILASLSVVGLLYRGRIQSVITKQVNARKASTANSGDSGSVDEPVTARARRHSNHQLKQAWRASVGGSAATTPDLNVGPV